MLKILQVRLQHYGNHELPDVQAGFRKGRDQIADICWIIEKARVFQKTIYFCFIDYAKALTVRITINCGKFWKRWEYQTTWPASWETCMEVRKQQLELDMEHQTGSKQVSPCLFNLYAEYIMRNAGLKETEAGIKIAGRNSITSDMQMTPPLWQKVKKN